MDDYPSAIADFLEDLAGKIRGLTVDRVRDWATWAAVGLVMATLLMLVLIFLIVGLFRLLAELVGVEVAYLIISGLFLVVGAFLWSKRIPPVPEGPHDSLDQLAEHTRSNNG